jgi:hypothetical protein
MPQLHRYDPSTEEDRAVLANAGCYGEPTDDTDPTPPHGIDRPSARPITVTVTHVVGRHVFTEERTLIRTFHPNTHNH